MLSSQGASQAGRSSQAFEEWPPALQTATQQVHLLGSTWGQGPLLSGQPCLDAALVEEAGRELCDGRVHAVLRVQQPWLQPTCLRNQVPPCEAAAAKIACTGAQCNASGLHLATSTLAGSTAGCCTQVLTGPVHTAFMHLRYAPVGAQTRYGPAEQQRPGELTPWEAAAGGLLL